MYQLYSEFFVFAFSYVFGFVYFVCLGRRQALWVPVDKRIMIQFVMFVVQPLFYLHGDGRFRNRVINQGIWKAFKRELFYTSPYKLQNESPQEPQKEP